MTKIKQHFLDDMRHFKKEKPEEWQKKYREATHRVLSSVFFYISARNCCNRKNNLMAAIGYYYALFHMSKALLFLLPKYSIENLKGMYHSTVLKKMQTEFIQRNMLDTDFTNTMDELKDIREAANYSMGVWISLNKILKKQEPKIQSCMADAISLFKGICEESIGNVMALIGDGIGDDWMDSYLSGEEAQEVVNFLIEHNLTT